MVQASREVTGGTRLLWVTKALTIALILIVAAITSVKLIAGDSHGGPHFDMSVFTVARAIDSSSLFLGVVFGFLSFVGFEAAATLGEETREPKRNIPRALLGTAIFGGVFFVVVTAIELMGFGTDEQGVKAFTKSEALIGDWHSATSLHGWVRSSSWAPRSVPLPAVWHVWSGRADSSSR